MVFKLNVTAENRIPKTFHIDWEMTLNNFPDLNVVPGTTTLSLT